MIYLFLDGDDWVVMRPGEGDPRPTGYKADDPLPEVLAAVRGAAPSQEVYVGRPPVRCCAAT